MKLEWAPMFMAMTIPKRRRFGYRRIGVLLERKGMIMNHKKLYRICREEGLSVTRRRGWKRARGTAEIVRMTRRRREKGPSVHGPPRFGSAWGWAMLFRRVAFGP